MDLQEGQEAAIAANPDGVAVDVNSDGVGTEPSTQNSQYYTPEEMKGLDPMSVDTSRIPPEMLPFYKSMQSGWNQKFMEVSELKKSMEAVIAPKSQDPLEGWVDNYINDPEGVVSYVHSRIRQLETVDPLDTDTYRRARGEIAALQGDLDIVKERARMRETTQSKLSAVPQDLKEFAKTQGFSEKDLLQPAIAEVIKKLHKVEMASKGIQAQAVPKKPSEVIGAGTGLPSNSNVVQLNSVRKQVEANPTTDNIAALLAAKRKIQT